MAWLQWFGRLVDAALPAKVAETREEREAIARLRYDIYVAEQHDRHPDADHDRKRLWTEDDDDPASAHYYVGSPESLVGALKVRTWKAGAVPPELRRYYAMDALPSIGDRVIADVTMLVFRPGVRGTATVPGLTATAARESVARHGVELMFAACSPGHLPAYQRLGLRPFGGALINDSFGMLIPLVGLSTDLDHLRRCGSPWYPSLRALQREGRLPRTDLTDYAELLDARDTISVDPDEIVAEIEEVSSGEPRGFLEALPDAVRARLATGGFVVDVAPGTTVVRAGSSEQEMFVILAGVFEARAGEGRRTLGVGDVFGELAFFRKSGRRTADVVALSAGRVLVLRRKFLGRLRAEDPGAAADLLEALARALAERFG